MSYEHINYEVRDHIATITLNQPDRLNALTPLMRTEFLEAMQISDKGEAPWRGWRERKVPQTS